MNFIKIEGWSIPRALGANADGKHLDIQIKSICRDCPACVGRVAQMKARMVELGIEGQWREDESAVAVLKPDIEDSAKAAWLSNFFGSPVTFVTWEPFPR